MQSTLRSLALMAMAALLLACASDADGRLAELEAENEALRQRLAEPTSTVPTDGETPATSMNRPTTTTTRPPAPPITSTIGEGPAMIDGEEAQVLSVADGDTIRVLVDGESEPVRLIGINAPEAEECLAVESAHRLAELIGDGPVLLRRDISDRDRFDRLLRYVYSGDVFVNEAIVGEGLALAVRYEPDVAETSRLEAAQASAESAGIGIWAHDACGEASGEAVEIGEVHFDAAGDDNFNLNDEWVEFRNAGGVAVDLGGWTVRDESASHRYDFPSGFVLAPEAVVRLHTGCGSDTSTELFWCNEGSAVWNNSGDTVFLLDPNGNLVTSVSYQG